MSARVSLFITLVGASLSAGSASAIPIEAVVGTGPDQATLVIEFSDGADFAFGVNFSEGLAGSGNEVSGFDLLATLDAELALFAITFDIFPFGNFVTSISYDGHSDSNEPYPGDFWAYWERSDENSPWQSSSVGASARLALDGNWDGWVFSEGLTPPIPEPGTGLLVAMGLALLARRPRRPRRGGGPGSPIPGHSPVVGVARPLGIVVGKAHELL